MASYATTDQVRIRMQQTAAISVDETTMLEEIIEAASRLIDRTCRVVDDAFQAVGAASAMYFTAFGESFLRIPECTSVTGVAVKVSRTSTTYTDWDTPTTPMAGDGDWIPCRGDPEDPTFLTTPYNLLIVDVANGDYSIFADGDGDPTVRITAVWGTESGVPADIREACCMQSIKWFKKFQGAQASELGTDEFGVIQYGRGLSSEVLKILKDGHRIVPLYGGTV